MKTRNEIAVRFNKRASKMLVHFVNTRPESLAFEGFRKTWEKPFKLKWAGGEEIFRHDQHLVRSVWEGKKQGIEGLQVELALGIADPSSDNSLRPSPLRVDWDDGSLMVIPRDLNELVWLTLLQNSRHLAICGNVDGGCLTPYFLRMKANGKYCSSVCAVPSQREFKRNWFREHGAEWREKWSRGRATERKSNAKKGRK